MKIMAIKEFSKLVVYTINEWGTQKRLLPYVELHPLASPVEGEVKLGRMRVLMLPTKKMVVPLYTAKTIKPSPTGETVEVNVPQPSEVLVAKAQAAYIQGLTEGARKEIAQMPESGSMSQFNKTYAGKLAYEQGDEALLSMGMCILHNYTTGNANTTVVFALCNPHDKVLKVNVPSSLKGLVIGKQGSNIKGLQEKYARKIIIQ